MFATITNFLSTTPSDAVSAIWQGLGNALVKVKEGVYAILPEIMLALGDFWIILLPFAIFFVILVLNSFRKLVKGF